uniref:Uncharacterized protein n=1 Tax=Setaria italica TaxID=4555 RepID=K3Y0P8_SETIT
MQTKSASWVSYTPAPASPSVHRQRPPSTWDANRCLHSFMRFGHRSFPPLFNLLMLHSRTPSTFP